MRSREQKLIDIMFQIGLMIHSPCNREGDNKAERWFATASQEDVANWIAEQLRGCGFDTEPVGMSWGKLKNEI